MNGAFIKYFGDDRFGLCIYQDGKYVIKDRKNFENFWEYDSVDEMIKDGWAID